LDQQSAALKGTVQTKRLHPERPLITQHAQRVLITELTLYRGPAAYYITPGPGPTLLPQSVADPDEPGTPPSVHRLPVHFRINLKTLFLVLNNIVHAKLENPTHG